MDITPADIEKYEADKKELLDEDSEKRKKPMRDFFNKLNK